VSKFHAEAPQATVSEGLAHGPYVVARAGFKPTTLSTKGIESSNELDSMPRPTSVGQFSVLPGKRVVKM